MLPGIRLLRFPPTSLYDVVDTADSVSVSLDGTASLCEAPGDEERPSEMGRHSEMPSKIRSISEFHFKTRPNSMGEFPTDFLRKATGAPSSNRKCKQNHFLASTAGNIDANATDGPYVEPLLGPDNSSVRDHSLVKSSKSFCESPKSRLQIKSFDSKEPQFQPKATTPGDTMAARTPSAPYALSQLEILTSWTFWYFFVLFLILQSPGFGVKILVTSIMDTLYETTPAEGALVSSLFLITYSISRFFAGFLPSVMPVKNVFVCGGLIQGAVFLLVPTIVNNTSDYYGFVFLITVSGSVLAVLTTLGTVLLREFWGEVNFNKASPPPSHSKPHKHFASLCNNEPIVLPLLLLPSLLHFP
jgi:hypothetical protein